MNDSEDKAGWELFIFWSELSGPQPLIGTFQCDAQGNPRVDEQGYATVSHPHAYVETTPKAAGMKVETPQANGLVIIMAPVLRIAAGCAHVLRLKLTGHTRRVNEPALRQQYDQTTMEGRLQASGLVRA